MQINSSELILALICILSLGALAYLRMKSTHALAQKDLEHTQLEKIGQEHEALVEELKAGIHEKTLENSTLKEKLLESEIRQVEAKKASQEKLELLKEAEGKLTDTFSALSARALKSNNESFLNLAKTSLDSFQEKAKGDLEKRQQVIGETIEPLKISLEKVNQKISQLEEKRAGAYSGLTEQIKSLQTAQGRLHIETQNLTKALQSPSVRGQWGEMQLRRSVELAGMVNNVDFLEQVNVSGDEKSYRPDMLVCLPNERKIVIDAKTPLAGYLESLETEDPVHKKEKLKIFAKKIREHLTQLSAKKYWAQFDFTPEFVILFLPGESFFSAALQEDPTLIEFGVEKQVLIATPTTLIAMLKAVSFGWKQEEITKETQNISALGKELYERMATFSEHFDDLRRSLYRTVTSYNKSISSMETRVLPTARRFKDLHIDTPKEIKVLNPIDVIPSAFKSEELGALDL